MRNLLERSRLSNRPKFRKPLRNRQKNQRNKTQDKIVIKSYVSYKRTKSESINITKHRIFDALLCILESRQLKYLNKKPVPSVFHEKTKTGLINNGWSKDEIEFLENELVKQADELNGAEFSQNVPMSLYKELLKINETEEIIDKRFVQIPNEKQNRSACRQLENDFTQSEILSCNGFVSIGGIIRLDIFGNHLKDGFFAPDINNKTGLIHGLRVFRDPFDEKPFILRSFQKLKSSGVKSYGI